MRSFLFVYPNVLKAKQEQLGIAYLSGQLKAAGVETHLWDFTFDTFPQLDEMLDNIRPDFVGVSARSCDMSFALEVAEYIKLYNPDQQIIFGGPGPTLDPTIIDHPAVDVVLRGECDDTLTAYVLGARNNQPGLVTKDKRIPLDRPPNIDSLYHPDHGMFRRHFNKPFHGKDESTLGMIMTSRGCPFECIYCSNKALRELHSPEGQACWTRYRDIDSIIHEMKECIALYGTDHFYIADDTFNLNRAHVLEFCKKYKKEIGLPWYCMGRCDTANEKVFKAMKDAGCEIVLLGVESGKPKLRRFLGRNMSNRQIVKAFTLARKVGLHTISFNMVGIPGETYKDALLTIELNGKCKPDECKMTIMTAFPGTPLYDYCLKNGYISTDDMPTNYYEGTNLETEMSKPQKIEIQDKLRAKVMT
jgi:radical SAM superfamily enzyme YgiQ (UPF0313 family)|tara:strand:- start:5937 stop:7187 length:1251 start_codon:yes stop_codon:yes gene_type:complete